MEAQSGLLTGDDLKNKFFGTADTRRVYVFDDQTERLGTVYFSSYVPAAGVNAPVYDLDGTTKLEGPDFVAQLYAGPTETSLSPVASPIAFRTGPGAGYVLGLAVTIPSVAAGQKAFVQIRVWALSVGKTYEEALAAKGKTGRSRPP